MKVKVYPATQEVLWRHLHLSWSSFSSSLHTRLMSPFQHWEWLCKKVVFQISLISGVFQFLDFGFKIYKYISSASSSLWRLFTCSICCQILPFPLGFSPLTLLSCHHGPSYLEDIYYAHVLCFISAIEVKDFVKFSCWIIFDHIIIS